VILVDSCGWLELFASSPLGEAYRPALENAAELLVPTICLLEVGRRLLTWRGGAAALPCADSIIYVTARRHGAELWTHDAHFRDLPGVRFVATPVP